MANKEKKGEKKKEEKRHAIYLFMWYPATTPYTRNQKFKAVKGIERRPMISPIFFHIYIFIPHH